MALTGVIVGQVAAMNVQDSLAVRAILDASEQHAMTVDSVTTVQNDRVVTLDLGSKDIAKIFISELTPDIGKLTALEELSIANNELETLPGEIGNCTALRILDAANNELASLPESMASLTNMTKIDLRHNEFTVFPPQLLHMKKLWYIHLRGNEIAELPENIGTLSALKELYLRNNELRTLPHSITQLELDYLEILDNHLCDLPSAIDAWVQKNDAQYMDWQDCREDDVHMNKNAPVQRR
jgi:Leucine-rich repeat (LRR) protein